MIKARLKLNRTEVYALPEPQNAPWPQPVSTYSFQCPLGSYTYFLLGDSRRESLFFQLLETTYIFQANSGRLTTIQITFLWLFFHTHLSLWPQQRMVLLSIDMWLDCVHLNNPGSYVQSQFNHICKFLLPYKVDRDWVVEIFGDHYSGCHNV